MEIKTFAVIGAGTMGNGIAHVAAQVGFQVILVDVDQKFLDRALSTISTNCDRMIKKGTLSEEQKAGILASIRPTTHLEEVAKADIAVEAVPEDESLKREIFKKLDHLLREGTILASNTSSISITALAAVTGRPDKVVGMHFMNPVPVMKLVEVISGLATSEETLQTTLELASRLGKTCTRSRDFPGFLVNRILMPMINEAIYALYEGVGSAEDIDTGMELGTNHPMGPLRLADLIGLDTCLAILEVLHQGLGDSKYRPCPLLRQYVDAGFLGRKTGRGFYVYGG